MSDTCPVYIPKETVSDETVTIVEINHVSGSDVEKGEIIFCVETSKSVMEIEAPRAGVFTHKLKLSEMIPVGELAAFVSKDSLSANELSKIYDCDEHSSISESIDAKGEPNKKFSKKALALIDNKNISTAEFSHLGFVKEQDVKDFISRKDNAQNSLDRLAKTYSAEDVVLIGGGGHAKMCIDTLKGMGKYNIIGILDPILTPGELVLDIPIIGDDDSLMELYKRGLRLAVNGVGSVMNNKARVKIFENLKRVGFSIPTIVHPMAVVERSAQIKEGAQIMMGALVGSNCVVSENCIINSGSIVSHDSVIESHAHIAPGAVLAGNVCVGSNAVIGMAATIFFSVKIGENTVINNGVNIFSDIEAGQLIAK